MTPPTPDQTASKAGRRCLRMGGQVVSVSLAAPHSAASCGREPLSSTPLPPLHPLCDLDKSPWGRRVLEPPSGWQGRQAAGRGKSSRGQGLSSAPAGLGTGRRDLLHLVGDGGCLPLRSESCQVSKNADRERRDAPARLEGLGPVPGQLGGAPRGLCWGYER